MADDNRRPQPKGEKKMTTIGNASISIEFATLVRQSREDGSVWLNGTVSVVWRADRGGRTYTTEQVVEIGCWADSDDDHAEWCAANEGARIIEQCIAGQPGRDDTRGSFARLAFAAECEALGIAACGLLREEAAEVAA